MASSAANLLALGWFGMWMGLTSRSTNLATLKTLTLGCKVNQYETEFVRQGFLADAEHQHLARLARAVLAGIPGDRDRLRRQAAERHQGVFARRLGHRHRRDGDPGLAIRVDGPKFQLLDPGGRWGGGFHW